METSPLTLGYEHARAASVATQSSNTTVAINEHTLAASEFSKAASGTSSTEALRTLRLLEQHHQRLAQLLRFPTENQSSTITDPETRVTAAKPQSKTVSAAAEHRATRSEYELNSSSPLQNSPVPRHPRRLPTRDLTSSIASNLASARGIRSNYTRQPSSPSISIYQVPGSLEILPRRDGKRTSVPTIPEHSHSRSALSNTNPKKREFNSQLTSMEQTSHGEDGFSQFYNTFENIFSKISAPLAFAGLPLITEEAYSASNSPSSKTASVKRWHSSKDRTLIDELDLTKHFSRAALRASEPDENTANDSFYVVPTTGHTVSYAHMISFDQKERQRMAMSMHSDNPDVLIDLNNDEDFVDARETPMPSVPRISWDRSRNLSSRGRDNKLEELTTENASLKTAMDKLSKRLHAFEISAQYNSMALAESMRLMRDRSPGGKELTKDVGSDSSVGNLRRRIQELEEQIMLDHRETDCLKKENEKLKSLVSRYRERWEKLKEGAKSRREGKEGATAEPRLTES